MNAKQIIRALALAAGLSLSSQYSNAEETPVAPEEQAKYDEIQKKRGFEKQTTDVSSDVISAAWLDFRCGNNDSNTSKQEHDSFREWTEDKPQFYSIVLGPKKGASTGKTPYTNNPFDYLYPKGYNYSPKSQELISAGKDEVISRIAQIEKENPALKLKGRLGFISLSTEPLKVTGYFERKDDSFVEKPVLAFRQNYQPAAINTPVQQAIEASRELSKNLNYLADNYDMFTHASHLSVYIAVNPSEPRERRIEGMYLSFTPPDSKQAVRMQKITGKPSTGEGMKLEDAVVKGELESRGLKVQLYGVSFFSSLDSKQREECEESLAKFLRDYCQ